MRHLRASLTQSNPASVRDAGERIERTEFDRMLSEFYAISNLDEEGHPQGEWRRQLETMLGQSRV